jgi:hypothetical protein
VDKVELMNAATVATRLAKALAFLRAGNARQARARLAPLGADLIGGAPVPRAAWIVQLLARGRLDEAEAEIEAQLSAAQTSTFVHAPTAALLQTALATYGEAGLANAGVAAPHEIAALTRPGAALGADEPLLRQRLLTLLLATAARAA